MEKLPKWCVTDKRPAIYDTESATVIEQTARLYGAMNELIEETNEFTETTNEHIAKYEKSVDDKLKEQDEDIEHEKSVVIPATVESVVNNHIKNGDFDKQIDKSLNNLNVRVDNLLGSVTEGSTTLDAEVIDIRTDANGYIHDNAGNALRAIDERFIVTTNMLDNSVSVSGFLNKGSISPNEAYSTSVFIPVEHGKTYFFGNNSKPVEMRFVNFFNANKQYIVNSELANYLSFTVEDETAKYVRITYASTFTKPHLNEGALMQFEYHFYNGIEGFKALEEKTDYTKNGFIASRNLISASDIVKGVFDNYGVLVDDVKYNVTGFIPVEVGKEYFFSSNGVAKQMRFISAYNINKAFIGYLPDNSGNVHSVLIDRDTCIYIRITYPAEFMNIQLEENGVTEYTPEGLLIPYERVIGVEQSQVNNSKWYGKKVAWIGSSITQGYKWCEVVNNYFNFNATNCGVGGTAMCNESVASMCNVERLLGQYENVVDPNTGETTATGVAIPDDVEVIFVEAGTNDWARNWALGEKSLTFNDNGEIELNIETFYGACHQFFKNATELFPNATIVAVGTPFGKMANRGVFNNKYGLLNNQGLQSVEYGDALAEVAGLWGCYAFNFGREMGINDNNIASIIPDGLHLNTADAYTRAGNVIINNLLKIKL